MMEYLLRCDNNEQQLQQCNAKKKQTNKQTSNKYRKAYLHSYNRLLKGFALSILRLDIHNAYKSLLQID